MEGDIFGVTKCQGGDNSPGTSVPTHNSHLEAYHIVSFKNFWLLTLRKTFTYYCPYKEIYDRQVNRQSNMN